MEERPCAPLLGYGSFCPRCELAFWRQPCTGERPIVTLEFGQPNLENGWGCPSQALQKSPVMAPEEASDKCEAVTAADLWLANDPWQGAVSKAGCGEVAAVRSVPGRDAWKKVFATKPRSARCGVGIKTLGRETRGGNLVARKLVGRMSLLNTRPRPTTFLPIPPPPCPRPARW